MSPVNLPLGGKVTPKGRTMSRGSTMTDPPAMTTTSYAILGLLAVKSWTTHELVLQVDRSLRRFWPRAQSKLYDEPKKLVSHGYARADGRLGRAPPPHPIHHHEQGPTGSRGLAPGTRGRTGAGVRAAAEDQLRGQRQQGRHPHQSRGHQGLGAQPERGESRHRSGLPARAWASSRNGLRSTSSSAASSTTSTSLSPSGPNGPRSVVEEWPDDVLLATFDIDAAEEAVRVAERVQRLVR